MAQTLNKLSARQVTATRTPGYYGDGGNLWLQVGPTGSKAWLFRYTFNGKAKNMGLGSVNTVSLAEARQHALAARKLLQAGIDPKEARDTKRREISLAQARSMTFNECSTAFINAHKAGWKNAKHVDQWTNTLSTYAGEVFGEQPVASIDTPLVMKCLEPIWSAKPETASRLRCRIERVLDWATVSGFRAGENPARWKGHLDKLLPAPASVKKVSHHAALPYKEITSFMTELSMAEGIGARALMFAILTAARTNEVVGATWDEIDLKAKLWTIPAERMKAKKEHRVPLSAPAVSIIKTMAKIKQSQYIFPGAKPNKPMSNMAMLETLRRMERKDITAHGFRSTFKDWAAETTTFPAEVSEMALAHTVGNKVEAAYRRGDLFEKRRQIMEDWARWCSATSGGTSKTP